MSGKKDYDALTSEEQAVVRAGWSERMTALSEALRLDQKFAAEDRPYVELDDGGAVVRRDPDILSPRFVALVAAAWHRGDLSEGQLARILGTDRLGAREWVERLGRTSSESGESSAG